MPKKAGLSIGLVLFLTNVKFFARKLADEGRFVPVCAEMKRSET